MSDSPAGEIGKTLFSFVAWILVIGGVVAVIAAFIAGNVWFGLAGAAAIILAQPVHSATRRQFATDLQAWATKAVAGVGPLPPAAVRMSLARIAMSGGPGGDFKRSYQYACQMWAVEQGDSSLRAR